MVNAPVIKHACNLFKLPISDWAFINKKIGSNQLVVDIQERGSRQDFNVVYFKTIIKKPQTTANMRL